jgi:hypothetical protein
MPNVWFSFIPACAHVALLVTFEFRADAQATIPVGIPFVGQGNGADGGYGTLICHCGAQGRAGCAKVFDKPGRAATLRAKIAGGSGFRSG